MNEFTMYVSSLISLCVLAILIFWLYRDYRIDSYRQKMFQLRDDLFDEALSANLPFDSAAYGMLRTTINGSIRFAHRLSFFQFMFFSLMVGADSKHLGKSFSEKLDEKMEGLTESQADLVKRYQVEMNYLLIEHVIMSSPILLLTVIIPVLFLFKAKEIIIQFMETFRSPIDRLDSAALSIGS